MSYLTDPHTKLFPPPAGNVPASLDGRTVRDLNVEAALSDLRAEVNRLRARLPAGTQANFQIAENSGLIAAFC